MKNPIIKIVPGSQNGQKMYCGFIGAYDLAKLYSNNVIQADTYDKIHKRGYQRTINPLRAKKFARFISGQETVASQLAPTNIGLYVRDPSNFPDPKGGECELPLSSPRPLAYIVEGQHRAYGYDYAFQEGFIDEDFTYDVPVSIIFWDPILGIPAEEQEQMIFYEINNYLKKILAALGQTIMTKTKGIDLNDVMPLSGLTTAQKREYATPLTIELANTGPWKGNINEANASGSIANQTSFSASLVPILEIGGAINGWTGKEIAELTCTYWESIFDLCPKAHGKDKKQYLLMKTAGMFVCNKFLAYLIQKYPITPKTTKAQFTKLLVAINTEGEDWFSDDAWESGGVLVAGAGSSQGAYAQLFTKIRDQERAIPTGFTL